MNHILVPIGSTESASSTLQYAIDLAEEMGAKVFVFRAYKALSKAGTLVNVNELLERETHLYIRSIIRSVETKGTDVKIISAKGGTLQSIHDIDNELGVDLIVLAPKSNSVKEEVFLGMTTGSIVKQAKIPVLIVPEYYAFKPFQTALIAFKSGKLDPPDVLNPLKAITHFFQAKIDLLLVKTPECKEENMVLDPTLKAIQNTFAISESTTIFEGVLTYLRSNKPDLLCVLKRKRGFFQKLWKKNTVLKSEFYCTIPLLILYGRQ